MVVAGKILIGLVALQHLYTLWIEMFAWETKGRKAFKEILPEEVFTAVKPLAANLGLYNGFLSAGLIWSLLIQDTLWKDYVAMFFLACVIIAGIYGAVTGSIKIFYYQALPSIITLLIVIFK